jgi:hypothetical protein
MVCGELTMWTSHWRHSFHSTCLLALIVAALAGCGAAEPQRQTVIEPDKSPEFAKVEGLLDYFNQQNTQLPPNVPALASQYLPESDLQRGWVIWLKNNASYYEVDKAMYEKFNEPFLHDSGKELPKPCGPAKLNVKGDRRAEGSYAGPHGETRKLYLVWTGGRWWISGRTLEESMTVTNPDSFAVAMSRGSNELEGLSSFIAQIRNGEFKTAADARAARIDMLKTKSKNKLLGSTGD